MVKKNPFVKASTKRKRLKILLYGDSGAGKTLFALSFPKSAVIDLEGGTDFYADRFDFSVMDTRSFAEVMEAVDFLENEKHEFETVTVDPVTIIYEALQDGRLEFKAKKNEVDTENIDFNYKDWGQIKRNYKMLMTRLINLDMHVIMIARQKDKNEKNKKGDMVKIGETFDGEKGTPYNLDIFGKLIVENNKRVLLIEKSRPGDWDKGSRIENPNFESFKHLLVIDNGQAVHHASEEDAAKKDAEFFRQREVSVPNEPARDNSNKGINAPTLQNIFTWFNALGLPSDYELRYKQYCYKKYSVQSMAELTAEQIQEQRAILTNAMNIESNKQKLREHLATYQILDSSSIDIPAQSQSLKSGPTLVPSAQYETPKQPEPPKQEPPKTNGTNGTNGDDEKTKANGRKLIIDKLSSHFGGDVILINDFLGTSLPGHELQPDMDNLAEFSAAHLKNIYAKVKALTA